MVDWYFGKVVNGGRYFLPVWRFCCWLAASSSRVADIIRRTQAS